MDMSNRMRGAILAAIQGHDVTLLFVFPGILAKFSDVVKAGQAAVDMGGEGGGFL